MAERMLAIVIENLAETGEITEEETQQIMTAIAIVSANCILNVSDGNEGLIEANCDTLRTQILNMCMQTVRRTKH